MCGAHGGLPAPVRRRETIIGAAAYIHLMGLGVGSTTTIHACIAATHLREHAVGDSTAVAPAVPCCMGRQISLCVVGAAATESGSSGKRKHATAGNASGRSTQAYA
jgi:hypothetical protein